jgi:hypothetical protein
MDPNNPFDNPDQPGNANNPWHDPNAPVNPPQVPPVPPPYQQPFYQQPHHQQQQQENLNEPQFFQGAVGGYYQGQLPLPNATLAMVLGIIGLVIHCNVIGLTLNIVAVVLASKALKMTIANPTGYSEASIKQAKAGRTCGTIGLVLFGLWIVVVVALGVSGAWD